MSELNIITGSGKGNVLVNVDDNYFTIDEKGQLTLNPLVFLPSYKNITAKLNATTPNTKVDVAWDYLYIGSHKIPAKAITLDINAYGAGGLDDIIPTNSTWYYLYAICNDAGTTVSAILSASATAPTLPSGYTRKRWISAVYRQSDGTFRTYQQLNNYCGVLPCAVIVGSATSLTVLDISSFVPHQCTKIYGLLANTAGYTIFVTATATGCLEQKNYSVYVSHSSYSLPLLTTNRTIYYKVTGAAGTVEISGYEVAL